MKRILSVLMLCIGLSACEPPTTEKKIEIAFKQFVKENFNDPSNLKEIINISPNDTMTVKSIGEIKFALEKLRGCVLESDSLRDRDMKILEEGLTPSVINKFYGDQRILSILDEQMNISNDRIDWLYINGDNYNYLKHQIDTCYNSIDSSMFKVTYEIKTRVEEKGELQIVKFYAIVDKENIDIYSQYPTFNDYSPEIERFFEYVEEYQPLLEQLSEYSTKQLTLSRRLLKALHIDN